MNKVCGKTSKYGCGKSLPIEDFKVSKANQIDAICKSCRKEVLSMFNSKHKEYKKKWRRDNAPRIRKYNNNRNAKKNSTRHGLRKYKQELFEEMGPICAVCEKECHYNKLRVVEEEHRTFSRFGKI